MRGWGNQQVMCSECCHSPHPSPASPPHLLPQDGINPQWQAFYFANTKYPLKSVKINGLALQRNEFQVGDACG